MNVYILVSEQGNVEAVYSSREKLVEHVLGFDDYLEYLYTNDGPREIPLEEALNGWTSNDLIVRSTDEEGIVFQLLEREVE